MGRAQGTVTALFERFAIAVLLETSITGATTILGISWDEAHHIMERAVARGMARRPHSVPKYLGIDEKSLAKGQRYATMVCDLEHWHVIDLAEDRTKDSVLRCLGRYSINDLSAVEAIAIDMWEPYIQQLCAIVGDADDKIVFDRFHIVGHMNNALDQVRRRENKALRADGDDRLVGSKHLWLYGPRTSQLQRRPRDQARLRQASRVEPQDRSRMGAQGVPA